ncbi:MAG: signal peptidase I [Candidatus Dormibacteria bacterium]
MPTIPEGEDPVRERRSLPQSRRAAVVGRLRVGIWSLAIVAILGGLGFAAFAVLSGSWTVTPILSGSMRPGFPIGGVAVSERVPMRSLAVRDVILFKNPYHPDVEMVHRIIQLKVSRSGQPVIKTQGDANSVPDPWTVTLDGRYVYVVQYTLPLLGYPAVYTNHGVDLMVAGVILLVVLATTVLSLDHRKRGRPGQADPPNARRP